MARFSLFANPDGAGYLLDVQADLFDHFDTRMVVPLLPKAATPPPLKKLHPVFEIDGKSYVMATPLMAAVPTRSLKQQAGSLAQHHYEIVGALDMLFQGN